MNFNIYLDTALGAALQKLARRRKVTRNALIRKAVEELLKRESHSQDWSPAVLAWQGESSWPPFESQRQQLREPTADPLA